MRPRANRVLTEALSLPRPARAALAGRLLDSLDEEVDAGYEKAWAEEIERRLAQIDSGKAKLVPWSQVRRDVLRSRREKKRRPAPR